MDRRAGKVSAQSRRCRHVFSWNLCYTDNTSTIVRSGAQTQGQSSLETRLKDLVQRLKDSAFVSLSATEKIIKAHQVFTRLVADSFKLSSKSGHILYDSGIEGLASDIKERSKNVSAEVDIMRENFKELVVTVEEVHKKRRKAAMKRKMWAWLKTALQIFAAILGAASTLSSVVGFPSPDCGMAFSVGAALMKITAIATEPLGSKGV